MLLNGEIALILLRQRPEKAQEHGQAKAYHCKAQRAEQLRNGEQRVGSSPPFRVFGGRCSRRLLRPFNSLGSHFVDFTKPMNLSFSLPTAAGSPSNLKNQVFSARGTIAATRRCFGPLISANFAPPTGKS